MMMMLGEG